MSTIDPARLYTALLNTGLQSKDNPLYQVIHELIRTLAIVNIQVGSISSSPSSVPSITQQLLMGLDGIDGVDGLDGATGSQGLIGLTGLTGLTGSDGLDGLVGEDGLQGQQGISGLDGLQGIPGLDGLDSSFETPFQNFSIINSARDLSDGVIGTGKIVLSDSPALTTSPTAPTQATTDNSTKLATTAYVTTAITNAIAGVNPAVAVQAATAAVLPNTPTYNNGVAGIGATLTAGVTNTALVVDGYTPILNDRVLVKNQASAFQNGVYFVSQLAALGLAWILTRALDYNAPSDINNTGAIPVTNGTVNIDTTWVLTSTVNTVGTDALTYVQFSLNPNVALPVNKGGTGVATFGANGVLIGEGTGNVAVTGAGTAGQALTSNGAGVDPTFQNITVTPTIFTSTTTGNIDDLDFSNANLIRMNNATLATIRGLKAGTAGQQVTIVSIGAGQVNLSHQDTGDATAGSRLICIATSGKTPLAAGVGTAVLEYDGTTSRWRLIAHEQGAWITPAFAAGDYTYSGTGVWTVAAGNVSRRGYRLSGRTMEEYVEIEGSSVTVGDGSQLKTVIQGGFTAVAPGPMITNTGNNNAGGYINGNSWVSLSTTVSHYRAGFGSANWSVSVGATALYAYMKYEVV